MSTIVNVKVAHIRPKYNNLKEWMNDENNVYIGRRGIVFVDKERFPKTDSIWCNPFKISKECDRNCVIQKYEKYIREKIENDENLLNELLKLKGKILGCWCKPDVCHGDILLKLIEEFDDDDSTNYHNCELCDENEAETRCDLCESGKICYSCCRHCKKCANKICIVCEEEGENCCE